jgi:NAD-dependent deacetylase
MSEKAELFDRLKEARNILFFTGAGISAESGVPTFRGKDGLWKNHKPEELANLQAFLSHPDEVWEWYQYRRGIIRKAAPNPAHLAIAEMQEYFQSVIVVTQNVDNLHIRAGSKEVYELHGNLERNYCIRCGKTYSAEEFDDLNEVPHCRECGGLIRPDVVWFGEALPQDVYKSALQSARESDVCFVVGTSAVVYPAAYVPYEAKRSGAFLVEINLNPTELTPTADLFLPGKAGEVLPEILRDIKSFRGF